MNSVFIYQQKRKANNKSVKSKEFAKKICFFFSSSSYWEIAKWAQFDILFQNITLPCFICKLTTITTISESSTFWYPQ